MTVGGKGDLSHYLRVYDNALDAALCGDLLTRWQQHASQQQANGAGVQAALAQSAWTELDLAHTRDASLSQRLSQEVARYYTRYNTDVGLSLPISPPQRTDRWIVKRYRQQAPGTMEQFQPHFDSVGPASNRYLVYLWYLNSVDEGGETAFVDLGQSIRPQAGRLLMFPPYWMFQHAGRAPLSGDKYILSTYLRYG